MKHKKSIETREEKSKLRAVIYCRYDHEREPEPKCYNVLANKPYPEPRNIPVCKNIQLFHK